MGELPQLTQGDSIKMSNFFPHFPNPQYEDSGAAFKHGICVKGYVEGVCISVYLYYSHWLSGIWSHYNNYISPLRFKV